MADEAVDVKEPEPTGAGSSPVDQTPGEPTPVGDDVKAQQVEPEDADAKLPKTVPYKRFQKVLEEKKALEELLGPTPAISQPSEPAYAGSDEEAEKVLERVVGKAISNQLGDVTKTLRSAAVERQIDEVRQTFPDFDQHQDTVVELMKSMPSLKNVDKPLAVAYLMAKGMTAAEAASAAKQEGVQEAYAKIDQKIGAQPSKAGPKAPEGGESDLLKRFKSGQMTAQEQQANWNKILEEMASSQS